MVRNSFETLVWYNGENSTQIIPWLASDYSISANAKTVTFHLRQGINFADGTPMNATSVWFSLNRLLIMDGTSGTGTVGSQAAWIIQQLLNTSLSSYFAGKQPWTPAWVQQVLNENFVTCGTSSYTSCLSPSDPYTVTLNLQHPSASLPYLLAGEWASIMSPSWVVGHDLKSAISGPRNIDYVKYFNEMAGNGTGPYMNLPKSPVMAGSGPYYIYSVDATTYNMVLKANPHYWGGPSNFQYGTIGQAKIPEIDIVYVPDQNSMILDLKAGKATIADISAANIYSLVDRNAWLQQGKFVSIVPGATVAGPYPSLITGWFEFGSNVTDTSGRFKSFQPFSDIRFREAAIASVNISDILINVGNRLAAPATTLIPPGLAPTGSYDPTIPWQGYNLTLMAQLLADLRANPITSGNSVMHFYNGTRIPAGVVDNSFSPSNPKTINLVYVIGGVVAQNILVQMATNLNKISVSLGLTFTLSPLPSGQRYTLMSEHQLDFAPAGWQSDYNWVTDWTNPMLASTGTYFSWSLWNSTLLDHLVAQINAADSAGNTSQVISLTRQANVLINKAMYYMWEDYPLLDYPISTWLHGTYYNIALGDPFYYFPTYYYAAPS
ncbi:MAG: ABC transporter substrate-binding protein [Nitrososphaerales archaeon]